MENDKTIAYIESFLNCDYVQLKENLEILLTDYKRKSKRLDRIIAQSDKQQNALLHLNEELDRYKNHLEERVEQEIKNRQEKEKMLFQQSKLAAMGEMIDAVAHQWKQPINIISMQVEMLKFEFEEGIVDEDYISTFQENISRNIQHMINTLDEFRTFFRPNKNIAPFSVREMIDKVLLLIKDELIKNKISVEINEIANFEINGIENELKHLVLNIISNAKDAFNDNNIKNRKITINIDKNIIEIVDNAGGIPPNIIDDIFKANVTTKAEGKGTGIGLYMSSQIATKHNGTLEVENVENGAKFIFKISH